MSAEKRIIGIDESGKGDFFGPLVIGALLASKSEENELSRLGVRDGKKISINKLLDIDYYLRERFPYATVLLMPEEYNQRYNEIKNLNKLLAWGHVRAISKILEKNPADLAISDKFGKSELIINELKAANHSIEINQFEKGESYIQVAAGSIIARAEFLRSMDKLSDEYAFNIPRGASSAVDEAGRQLVKIHGPEVLPKIAKMHFKNQLRVLTPSFI